MISKKYQAGAPVSIYQFDRNILHTPTSERAKINSPQDVAEFLSKTKKEDH